MRELIFLKQLILISQIDQKSVIFVIIGTFLDKNFNYEAYLSNFNDVAIFSIKRSDYRIRFWYMSKNDAINLLNNSVLDNIIMEYYNRFWCKKNTC